MPRKLTAEEAAEVVHLIQDGRHTVLSLAKKYGVTNVRIVRAIQAAGVKVPTLAESLRARWAAAHSGDTARNAGIVRRHDQGESVLSIANSLGISRGVVVRVLNEAGIRQRGVREAGILRYKGTTEDERKAITRAANAAARGSKHSEDTVQLRASKSAGKLLSKLEALFFSAFDQAGIPPKPNYQVGRYLIDLAYPEKMLAVEVDGGNWHDSPKKREQDRVKTEFLTARGWRVIRLRERDLGGCVEKVLSNLEVAGASPLPAAE